MTVVSHPRFTSGLGANFDDSARHAFDHFQEANQTRATLTKARLENASDDTLYRLEKEQRHHCKWIAISVHHMAEILFSAVLFMLTREHPHWHQPKPRFPWLRKSTSELLKHHQASLSGGEILLIREAEGLIDARDQLIHRDLPSYLDPSRPAVLAIRLWRVGRRWFHGAETASADWGQAGVLSDINGFIPWRERQSYFKTSADLLQELSPGVHFDQCPECYQAAIDAGFCQACFLEVESVDCPNEDCGASNIVPAWVGGMEHGGEYLCEVCDRNLGL